MLGQLAVGVGRDRVGDRREQGQVVVRIAVEPGFGKAFQRLVHAREPIPGVLQFARAIGRDPDQMAGQISLGRRFRFGRDQVLHTERFCNRRRDEAVGRGGDADQVAGVMVFLQQGARFG